MPFFQSISKANCTDNFQELISLSRLGQGHRATGKGASYHGWAIYFVRGGADTISQVQGLLRMLFLPCLPQG